LIIYWIPAFAGMTAHNFWC